LDWEVVAIKGRGLGIRSMRDIPAYSRIIVELLETGKRVRLLNHECDANVTETIYTTENQKKVRNTLYN
jgi:hypothetical protein